MKYWVKFHDGRRWTFEAKDDEQLSRKVQAEITKHYPAQVHLKGSSGYVLYMDRKKDHFNWGVVR